jgi:hypothetical protein
MLSYCLGLGAFSVSWLSLSCYKLACYYFPTLAEYFIYSHLPYFLHIAIMICCSEDEEYFDEDIS